MKKLNDEDFNYCSRYFMKNPSIICRNCNKSGHYAKMCTEVKKMLCCFCLGEHHFRECKSSVCFNCGLEGHEKYNC